MADTTQPNAEVATKLFELIARVEQFSLGDRVPGKNYPDREWILSTFARCLQATQGYYIKPK